MPAAPAGDLSEVPATSPPGLDLTDLSGQIRNLDEFAGQVVLVNFWASWCTPCLQEIPSLKRLAAEMAGQPFTIVAVNVGETKRCVQVHVRRLLIDFPILLDEHKAAFDAWGANILPTAYLLDRNGQIRYVARGKLEWDRIDVVETVRGLTDNPEPTTGIRLPPAPGRLVRSTIQGTCNRLRTAREAGQELRSPFKEAPVSQGG